MKKHRIAKEVKEQILNRIKNEGVTVAQAAKEHGVADGTIYSWIATKTDGGPTLSEVLRLKKENKQLFELVGKITLRMSEAQKKN